MISNKEELYDILKRMTLEEFATAINGSKTVKTDKEECNLQSHYRVKTLYTINELIEKYPFFTRYNINKAIQNDDLPYCSIGKKRMFSKSEVEKWLEKNMCTKKENQKYKI